MKQSRAFTLIELLVVIAIIAILAAILFPVFAQAKMAAKKSVALSGAKQIGLASAMYATDSDDRYVPCAINNEPGINNPGSEVNNPGSFAFQRKPFDMLLDPYIKSPEFWSVPMDSHNMSNEQSDNFLWDGRLRGKFIRRSFAIMSHVATVEKGGGLDRNTGVTPAWWDVYDFPIRSMTEFSDPSSTIAFAEVWPTNGQGGRVGALSDPMIWRCNHSKFAGRIHMSGAPGDRMPTGGDNCDNLTRTPGEEPTPGYAGKANYSMADGSARTLGWGQIRRSDFQMLKIEKPTQTFNP
jgi:prepilin-type N-terminal cleavage/methylation domain-containing protein/prepilin-type processing-associated H-X9-DG protein